MGIPVEMVQLLLKLLLKQTFLAVHHDLILTAQFHSLNVKESESGVKNLESQSQESEISDRLESDISLSVQPWSNVHFCTTSFFVRGVMNFMHCLSGKIAFALLVLPFHTLPKILVCHQILSLCELVRH